MQSSERTALLSSERPAPRSGGRTAPPRSERTAPPSGGPAAQLTERLLVVGVGTDPAFHDTVAAALRDATGDQPAHRPDADPVHAETVRRARRFLNRALADQRVEQLTADTLAELPAVLAAAASAGHTDTLALLLVDAAGAGLSTDPLADTVGPALAELAERLPAGLRADLSAYTVHVYTEPERAADPTRLAPPYAVRQLPGRPELLAADVVRALADFVQMHDAADALRGSAPAQRALAGALTGFLTARAGHDWGLHYYTGSLVTGLIGELEVLAEQGGNPVLRGPSEHALAAGALARWQLDAAPFLIVVTNGMVDEFRGTLANLRESRARGFIVCADSPTDAWFPFQGTVHAAEDSREVLRARRLEGVYLDDPARLTEDLATAFEAYRADRGPVVLLVSNAVLDAATPPDLVLPEPRPAGELRVGEDVLAELARLVGQQPVRMLWQCGPLDEQQRELTYELARTAGIALADSPTRPGTVARYHRGERVPEYLGTLGMFGCSARVHDFLHQQGWLRRRADQSLLFLNSRIPELATPFQPRQLDRSLHIAQVTRDASHLAPFADLKVHADATGLLRELRDRVRVDPEVLALRRAAIDETRDSASDMVHQLPLLPMSPNYFYHHLGGLLDELITRHDYRYTGLYDVGRGAMSAIRNLPRTGTGFSGWYGRALMGDALQAVPSVALTREGNVLAFVGDGATGLVPDILPTLIQQSVLYGARPAGNLTVFRLVDGGHSVIRTYRETQAGATADRQTRVLHLLQPEGEQRYGDLTVRHRHIEDVAGCLDELGERLRTPGVVDVYSVLLSHNNEGDGMSPAGASGWQRDELHEVAFTIARTARRAGEAARRSGRA
ncbi:hypothetical protein [Kitasatospora viridis]|uniref:Thiamine pyrophosphate-dependent acetolactate synthase large subunit-like protein n=1 Tax=Kitasatospora viridis TaxID=281105 RepID=A0A561UKD9_9ACTN|nr:hypothetical protein [Kitasatospora viridis]TWF99832.1 thiamine pyrophosphate-dependent acetolactate synthase large subunit-like protein [Kitasatospora viridis]